MNKFNLDYYNQQEAVRKACHALTGDASKQIKFFSPDEQNQCPRTDGKTIYLPRPRYSWSKEDEKVWWGSVLHEIGHNDKNCKEDFQVAKENNMDLTSIPGFILNSISDYSLEHNRNGEFYGRDSILSWGQAFHTRKARDNFTKKHDDDFEKIKGLRMFDLKLRETWMPDVIGESEYLYENCSELAKETYDKLMAKFAERYHKTSPELGGNATQRFDLAKEMFEAMYEEKDFEEEKKKGTEERGDDEEEQELMESLQTDDHQELSKVEKESLKKHSEGQPDWREPGRGETGEGTYIPYPANKNLIIDYENNRMINHTTDGYVGHISTNENSDTTWIKADIPFDNNISHGFRRKLRRLLQIASQAGHIYSQAKGKIHGKNLYKTTIKDASFEFRKRVFKQKKEKDILDVSVTILCDMSGSMGGDKIICAGQALISMHQLFASLNIPHELLGFTETNPRMISYIFKSFDKKVHNQALKDRLHKAISNMMQNADGDSIIWAWSRIVNRPTKRKLLIVLSDGQPATDNPGDIAEFTKKVIKSIERDKRVELFGIGIEDDTVKHYYKDNITINYADEIEKALLTILSTKILKRG